MCTVGDLHDPSNVLYLYGNPHGFRKAITNTNNIKLRKNQTVFLARIFPINVLQSRFEYNTILFDEQGQLNDMIILDFNWNDFSRILVNRLLDSNRGVSLNSLYQEYRTTMNSSISDNELVKLTEDFYDSVKDTEMFLLKKHYVPPFPKTSLGIFFIIKSI